MDNSRKSGGNEPVLSIPPYPIRQCECPRCRFRFPVTDDRVPVTACPDCGAPTRQVAIHIPHTLSQTAVTPAGPEVEGLLDNIRSVYNVGSMFRTADGAGLGHMHLGGITTTPDHPRVHKTALGAEKNIPWTKHKNGLEAALKLKERRVQLWAIENIPGATSLFETAADLQPGPIALIVGNEIAGIDPDILELCDRVCYIPMQGTKASLNVAVAFGVGAYFLRHQSTTHL